jgi:DNA-binding NarL/FixJ family response regulator
MGERSFRVGLVDDEEGFRNSFADALESQRLKVVFSRPDSTRILDDICEHKPDVVLLDVAMPREDGMRALRRIRSNAATATTRVLMLTVHNQSEMIVEALSKGKADGYLVKSAPLGVIFSGITQTARGGTPLVIAGITESGGYNRSLAQILFEVQVPLTEREMQIARLRARHFRSIDIARDIAPCTAM